MRRLGGAWGALCLLALFGCDDGDGEPAPPVDAGADAAVEVGACGDTPESIRDCVDLTRYGASLEMVARPRAPGSPHWQAVQDECAAVFEAAGFAVERQRYRTGVNVIGVKPGVDRPDEHILISAHYDHLGECAGADDNGTGVAGVMEAARALGEANYARTIVLACWDEEEFGKGGSTSYAARARAANQQIEAHFVFEMLGYRDARPNTQFLPQGFDVFFVDAAAQLEARMNAGDFIAMITHEGHVANAPFLRAAEAVELPVIPIMLADNLRNDPSFGQLRRSDHEPFWANDLPAMMLGDTGNFRNPNYHCSRGHDDIAELDLDFALKSVQATVQATAELAEIVTRADARAEPLPPPDIDVDLGPACDPLAQDCDDGERCALLFENGWQTHCLPAVDAPIQAGGDCERNAARIGDEPCTPGSICAFWGLPRSDPQARVCHPMCRADNDCDPDENCLLLAADSNTGGCVPRCDPVANDCPDGMRCIVEAHVDVNKSATLCALPGDAAIGEPCTGDTSCAAGECRAGSGVQDAVCRAYCRSDDDCGDGLTCFPILPQAGLPAGVGRCLPSR